MRKIMFVGRSEAGKTTLKQAMKGETITYHKTQYINHYDVIIDTPGEYAETKSLAGALAVYGCESDVIGLLMDATEPFSLYPPCVTSVSNREIVGVITKIDHPVANVEQAAQWLRLAGCTKIFPVCSLDGQGLQDILDYLAIDGEQITWEEAKRRSEDLSFRTKDQDSRNYDYQITVI